MGFFNLINYYYEIFISRFLKSRRDVLLELNSNSNVPIETQFYKKVVANPIHIFKLFDRTLQFKDKILNISKTLPGGQIIVDIFEREIW